MSAANTYRDRRWLRWMSVWTVLSLPGVGVALLAWGPVTVVGKTATVAVPLAMILFVMCHGQHQWEHEPRTTMDGRWIGRVVLCAVTFLLSMAAFAPIPGLTLLMVLIAGATTPPATDLARRLFRQPAPTHTQPTAVAPHPPRVAAPRQEEPRSEAIARAVEAMSDRELCRAWRHSFWTLHDTHDPVEKLDLVEHRQRLLDELEHRNAAALEAWLASGARACGGPDRHFTNLQVSDQQLPTSSSPTTATAINPPPPSKPASQPAPLNHREAPREGEAHADRQDPGPGPAQVARR